MLEGSIAVSTAFMIAMGGSIATYFWGKHSSLRKEEETVRKLITLLEEGGYVKTIIDKDGEEQLVKIDDIK